MCINSGRVFKSLTYNGLSMYEKWREHSLLKTIRIPLLKFLQSEHCFKEPWVILITFKKSRKNFKKYCSKAPGLYKLAINMYTYCLFWISKITLIDFIFFLIPTQLFHFWLEYTLWNRFRVWYFLPWFFYS